MNYEYPKFEFWISINGNLNIQNSIRDIHHWNFDVEENLDIKNELWISINT